jgi:uncharacterized membrane protein
MKKTTLAILAALSAPIALADDFKTTDGTEYKNVTVTKQGPDGITVKNAKAGVLVKLYFSELPKEVQERFNYDRVKGDEYSRKQNEEGEQFRKQREEALRQKAETARKDNEQLTKDQADIQRSAAQTQNAQALRTQLQQLQGKKNDLLKRIGQIEMLPEYLSQRSRTGKGGWYNYPNPARADLPSLKDHLNDVNLDIEQTRKQLQQNEQAQH